MFSLRGTTFGHHLSPRKGEAGAVPKITTIRHHQTVGALGLHFGRAQRRPHGVERPTSQHHIRIMGSQETCSPSWSET